MVPQVQASHIWPKRWRLRPTRASFRLPPRISSQNILGKAKSWCEECLNWPEKANRPSSFWTRSTRCAVPDPTMRARAPAGLRRSFLYKCREWATHRTVCWFLPRPTCLGTSTLPSVVGLRSASTFLSQNLRHDDACSKSTWPKRHTRLSLPTSSILDSTRTATLGRTCLWWCVTPLWSPSASSRQHASSDRRLAGTRQTRNTGR
mmetsp:Transcript_126276/g.188444  ORF Transcript_126276/g.188444 Transcript_126276/m.188444 type:complete len:205 (+) Transcript_126276:482-1096(+)